MLKVRALTVKTEIYIVIALVKSLRLMRMNTRNTKRSWISISEKNSLIALIYLNQLGECLRRKTRSEV